MTKTTEAKWRALIREQERSGQTVREFAAARGLASGTLFWWRSKLGRQRPAVDEPLVPVEILDAASGAAQCSIELQIGGDVVLRLPRGFDETTLRRVLAVLGRSC